MPRLKVTARSNSPFGTIDDAQHKFVIKVGTGLQGKVGANGRDGVNGVNGRDGVDGKDGASVPVANELGLSATTAASQKLVTEQLGNVSSVLDAINGVTV